MLRGLRKLMSLQPGIWCIAIRTQGLKELTHGHGAKYLPPLSMFSIRWRIILLTGYWFRAKCHMYILLILVLDKTSRWSMRLSHRDWRLNLNVSSKKRWACTSCIGSEPTCPSLRPHWRLRFLSGAIAFNDSEAQGLLEIFVSVRRLYWG